MNFNEVRRALEYFKIYIMDFTVYFSKYMCVTATVKFMLRKFGRKYLRIVTKRIKFCSITLYHFYKIFSEIFLSWVYKFNFMELKVYVFTEFSNVSRD